MLLRSSTKSRVRRGHRRNQGDGLPLPDHGSQGVLHQSQTQRVNFDYTLSPPCFCIWAPGSWIQPLGDRRAGTTTTPLMELGLKGISIVPRMFPKIQTIRVRAAA